ncbi:MAG TPA: penicillin-binding protein 1C [Rhizomicrobium sp.]|nr:penicillin-binding protein 1C [Rhizomicrobium sp.]
MNWKDLSRRKRTVILSVLGVLCALVIADRLFPPDMTRATTLSTEVLDRHGKLLRPFLSHDGYWRLKTTPADVSSRYLTLLKAYEDKRFDLHPGVDPLALARAVYQLASNGHHVSGASTLTMQVARLLEPRPRGYGAKLIQMIRAVQLEERYSKDEILSFYLTLAPFGGNLEGVRAASLAYFGKEPKSLSLSEAALLVALPQSPERQRPDRHTIAARRARDHVLARMIDEGVISNADVAVARHEGVPSLRLAMPLSAPHFAQHLAARASGKRVISTIDAPIQNAIERLVAREDRYMEDGASIAVVVVENKTRNVLAYVAGTNYWGTAGKLDLADRARSPGSALKPFVYGMAFDDLVLHPATLMQDQQTTFGDYAPRDFSGGFQGEVTAAAALRMSLNVPAVAVLEKVGPLRFTQTLQNAGAKLYFPTRDTMPSLPVALGGLGISLADLTMLYTGIADGGMAAPLRMTTDAPAPQTHRLFGPVAAYYLHQVLAGVSLPDGWAMGQGLSRARVIAFKTGTSYGFRDAWSAGFSNDYTVGVWVGRADGAPRADQVGRETAAPILLKVFELLPRDERAPPSAPAGAILVDNAEQLPESLRVFHRITEHQQVATNIPAPAISFPPNGSTVPLPEGKNDDIQLKAAGGREPLTWLVNGRLLGSYDRFQPINVAPDGEGVTRITVVDASGRSDTSQVRFKRMH